MAAPTDACYVEFHPKDGSALVRTATFFEMIKAAKDDQRLQDDAAFETALSERERNYFWRPTAEDWKEWREEWLSTPVQERLSDNMLLPQWTFDSMLDALWQGDYHLSNIVHDEDRAYLTFQPNGYPYGGVQCMIALLECFGHVVAGFQDGTGYCEYSARKEFWSPQSGR